MKVAIYNEPHGGGGALGGSEYTVAVLADAIARHHAVDFFHHRPNLTKRDFARTFDIDLENVSLRYLPHEPETDWATNPFKQYQQARQYNAQLSKGYDVFIASTHNLPPFCHAKLGILYVYFPFTDRLNSWPWKKIEGHGPASYRARLRRLYSDWEWRRRIDGYQIRAAISSFSGEWTEKRWGIEAAVIYPPVNNSFHIRPKENLILSIGRFTSGKISKRQLEMMFAYADVLRECPINFRYVSAGIVSDAAEDLQYLEKVRSMASNAGGEVLANVSRSDVKQLFEAAKVFWHATGWGDDDERFPERQEHFGISTVEAMAAGCVPVVINKGGQREIVEHGISGFLWNNLDELSRYTLTLIRDERRRERMSEAARERAKQFSNERFLDDLRALSQPFFPGLLPS